MDVYEPPAAAVTRPETVTAERPAAFYGCQWAVFGPGEHPAALTALLGLEGTGWLAVRADSAGRYIAGGGCGSAEGAREWCEGDTLALRDAEEAHLRACGEMPAPMTPALKDAPVVISAG